MAAIAARTDAIGRATFEQTGGIIRRNLHLFHNLKLSAAKARALHTDGVQ
jgi:hypothetical protein